MSIKRCAIYTRKSSEEGLEQDFNSLHAQREACAAYITSQRHEGWQAIKTHYDDGGYSGGSMERPGLQQLLQDIKDNKVDVIVVYKIDRLTRSLLDFAKMVETFDAHQVSFVSITQSFNTTTSMGRLTLNVLLSFAQFEREVTGERIRDKIAASKKKGIWMGGSVPFGYEAKDRMLIIIPEEAEKVRLIYNLYLEISCVRLLQKKIAGLGIGSKKGNMMSRGMIYNMLSNPIYIGQIRHKKTVYAGEHEAIISQELWDNVKQQIASNRNNNKDRPRKFDRSPLLNKLFDSSGEKLIPSYANKRGKRYRYYISQGFKNDIAANNRHGWRLPAQEIEAVVANGATLILNDTAVITAALQKSGIAEHYLPEVIASAKKIKLEHLIDNTVQKVELSREGISIVIGLGSFIELPELREVRISKDIPMLIKHRGAEMRLIIGGDVPARIDKALIKAVAKAHQWFNQLAVGQVHNMAEIASREGVDKSYVARIINLAFLAPDITDSIIAGRHPADLTIGKLTKHIDLPLDWSQQRKILGY